jgi:hypothetical protein
VIRVARFLTGALVFAAAVALYAVVLFRGGLW